jgi:hypothetical protein
MLLLNIWATIVMGVKQATTENKNQFTLNTMVAANAATRYSGTQSIQTTLSGGSFCLSLRAVME